MDTCFICQKEIEKPENNFSTGYGVDKDDNKICFSCCAEEDKKQMNKSGKITLYVSQTENGYKITNWPGSLVIPVNNGYSKGKHNIAGSRLDVWFTFNNKQWHGVNYGDDDLCYCKVIKSK
jgi:hypothetical protein